MSLYALGDLHLSFQTNKSMDIFGSVWKRHERKIGSCPSAGRISLSSSVCRGGRFCLEETMTCSGMRRRRSG